MRIKVGDKIYDGADEPIMVIFTEHDKEVLKKALSNKKWQGTFSRNREGYFNTKEDKERWIDDIPLENSKNKVNKQYCLTEGEEYEQFYLICEDCGKQDATVKKTFCPYHHDLLGEKIDATICTECSENRVREL